MAIYRIWNGPSPTTAAQVSVTTGTAIKTLLQIKPGTTQCFTIRDWGISFDGIAAATPGKVELIVTDVAATVTAHVAAGISKWDALALLSGDPTTHKFAVGTTSTGYTASGEGTVTASRQLDADQIPPTNQWVMQHPLGAECIVQPSEFLRLRVTYGAAITALCWVTVQT